MKIRRFESCRAFMFWKFQRDNYPQAIKENLEYQKNQKK